MEKSGNLSDELVGDEFNPREQEKQQPHTIIPARRALSVTTICAARSADTPVLMTSLISSGRDFSAILQHEQRTHLEQKQWKHLIL